MANETETFRERVPTVASMVDKAFNGDRRADERHVQFVVIAYDGDGSGDNAACMMSNISESYVLIRLFLEIIAGCEPPTSGPVGHA